MGAADHEVSGVARRAFCAKSPGHFVNAEIDVPAGFVIRLGRLGKTLMPTFGTFEFPGISVTRCHMPSFACAYQVAAAKHHFNGDRRGLKLCLLFPRRKPGGQNEFESSCIATQASFPLFS
ncbi:hypothetical protein JS562_46535 [Agrobacterium sp. S2]|nr:hypothetical protein [Agrobacterium sp. S2]